MRQIATEQLVLGMTVFMKVASPVRRWMRKYRGGARLWLTPVQYFLLSPQTIEFTNGLRCVKVQIAKVLQPYAIVYHYDGCNWVKLWLDTREARLFAPPRVNHRCAMAPLLICDLPVEGVPQAISRWLSVNGSPVFWPAQALRAVAGPESDRLPTSRRR
jgi:hypothetical protein